MPSFREPSHRRTFRAKWSVEAAEDMAQMSKDEAKLVSRMADLIKEDLDNRLLEEISARVVSTPFCDPRNKS